MFWDSWLIHRPVQADTEFYFFGWNPLCEDETSPEERPEWHKITCDRHSTLQELGLKFYGNIPEDVCAISNDGDLFWLAMDNKQCKLVPSTRSKELKDVILTHMAIRKWGICVAVAFRWRSEQNAPGGPTWHLYEFENMHSFKQWIETGVNEGSTVERKGQGTIRDIVAGSSAFAMLMESGEILNWGVSLRSWELGVVPSEKYPADTPHIIDALAGIPIKKIVALYDLYGAVSEYNDLYLWGRPSESWRTVPLKLDEYKQLVNLVDLGENVNVVDIGIGGNSLLCVTENGKVFGRGNNAEGQLFSTDRYLPFDNWQELTEIKASKVISSFWAAFLW
jgi:hypothetical protein